MLLWRSSWCVHYHSSVDFEQSKSEIWSKSTRTKSKSSNESWHVCWKGRNDLFTVDYGVWKVGCMRESNSNGCRVWVGMRFSVMWRSWWTLSYDGANGGCKFWRRSYFYSNWKCATLFFDTCHESEWTVFCEWSAMKYTCRIVGAGRRDLIAVSLCWLMDVWLALLGALWTSGYEVYIDRSTWSGVAEWLVNLWNMRSDESHADGLYVEDVTGTYRSLWKRWRASERAVCLSFRLCIRYAK